MMNNTQEKKKKIYKDYEIFQGKVRLVSENGKPVVMERDAAIELAKKDGLDLVQIGYDKNSFPHSICKILNYGKMVYESKKKDKEAARKSRIANAEAKEVYFSIRIDDGDLNTKMNKIRSFLIEDNDRVKICVKLMRREMNMTGMAKDLMKNILSKIDDIAELDSQPSFTGNIVSCTVRPKKR